MFIGILLAAYGPAHAGTVVKDGDDIIIDGQDYRFVTVDAFEPDQICSDERGADYDCGTRAKNALQELIGTQSVVCEPLKDTDRKYSRCRVCRSRGSDCPSRVGVPTKGFQATQSSEVRGTLCHGKGST